jgi:hypothetical protein
VATPLMLVAKSAPHCAVTAWPMDESAMVPLIWIAAL